MTNERAVLNAILRTDFYAFALRMFEIIYPGAIFYHADYLRLLASVLVDVKNGKTTRQIINLPPRSLKSFVATVCFSAWSLGHNPKLEIMIASHTIGLATTHLRDIRKIMKSDIYQTLFPGTQIGTWKDSEVEVETTVEGKVLAVTIGAPPTGQGCDLLIVDDPIKADDAKNLEALDKCYEDYGNGLLTRLNGKDGAVLLVMQRLAVRDLAGRLKDVESFKVLSLPLRAEETERIPFVGGIFVREKGDLLNPARMPNEAVNRLISETSDTVFAAQYQQNPTVRGEAIIKEVWLSYIATSLKGFQIVQSWDTATSLLNSSAFTVCLTWRIGDKQCELVDVFRERVDADSIIEYAKQLTFRFRPRTALVEEMNAGFTVGTTLRMIPGVIVDMIHPKGSKIERLERCRSAFQQQMVLLPKSAPWLEAYREELLAFPNGRYDDQVDATSQFLEWYLKRVSGEVRDPNFRSHPPVITGSSSGNSMPMRNGRSIYRLGQVPSLRTPPGKPRRR